MTCGISSQAVFVCLTTAANFWYKGELGFFDNYIIPLAKKLKDCNVFGVSSDEFLNYATANREEWEAKGQEIVAEMVEQLHAEELKHTIVEGEEGEEEDDCDEEDFV